MGPRFGPFLKTLQLLDLLHSLTDEVHTIGYLRHAREGILKMNGNLFTVINDHSHCKFRQAHLYHCNLVADFTLKLSQQK